MQEGGSKGRRRKGRRGRGGKPPSSPPCRLLPSQLVGATEFCGRLRAATGGAQRIARRLRNHEIEKSFRASGSRRTGTKEGEDGNLINGTGIVPCVRVGRRWVRALPSFPARYKKDRFPVHSQGNRARAPDEYSELCAIQLTMINLQMIVG